MENKIENSNIVFGRNAVRELLVSGRDIDKIYMEKESLSENQYYVDVNKKETLAQVFTDIRYKKADNVYMSEVLKRTLKQQKFDC